MGQGKISWYTHRLIHRNRELHDSYFRLLTIKHTLPKIEWAIELLYNSVRTGSQWVGDQVSWWQDVVEKASRKLSPRASGWAALENEKGTTLMAIIVGVNMFQFCSVSNSLSHANLTIKWEVYFFKRSLRSSLFIASICILHVYVDSCSIWPYNTLVMLLCSFSDKYTKEWYNPQPALSCKPMCWIVSLCHTVELVFFSQQQWDSMRSNFLILQVHKDDFLDQGF